MMDKHLEIFRHIEELYRGDVTDEEIIEYANKNTEKMQMWKEAFEDYLLHDVLDVIDDYFTKKNNRTPPRIAQIKALLNANHIYTQPEKETHEVPDCSFGLKFMQQDCEDGNMHWFVPDYQMVDTLIRQHYWGFVVDVQSPTEEEFHRCIEDWCREKTGYRYRFYSRNDLEAMPPEKREEILNRSRKIAMDYFNTLN